MTGEYRWDVAHKQLQDRCDELKVGLGGRCVSCGDTDFSVLEFHHIYGKVWRSRDYGPWARLLRYEEEATDGLIELLCKGCHKKQGGHPGHCFCRLCRGDFVPDF